MKSETKIQDKSTPKEKKVFVDIWAHETVLQKRRIFVEVPFDCDKDEIRELTGNTIDCLAGQQLCDAPWETEDSESFEVLDEVSVVGGVPDNVEADLTLVRNESDELVVEDTAT